MYSIKFPDMISNNCVNINLNQDNTATLRNLHLILSTTKNSLFGDPDFGCLLKYRLFEQNNAILKDLLIDDIYVAITTFIPQLSLKRSDIEITSDGVDIIALIKCVNNTNQELNTYNINLTTENLL